MLKNVLSFRDETILDMTAINAYKEHGSNLIDIGLKEKYLKTAAVYGANASGKSNIYFALTYFQQIVRESLNNVETGDRIAIDKYYVPFAFENDNKDNSEFEIIMILGNFEYQYGFSYNAAYIAEEWLYRKSLTTNRKITLFERKAAEVKFGATIRKECEVYSAQLPVETLVLSFFNKLKLKTTVFKDAYSGIMDIFVVPTDFWEDRRELKLFLPSVIDHEKEKLLDFLNAIDSGIRTIKYDESEKDIRFTAFHRGKNGEDYPLNLYAESEGTLKSIMLFIYVRMAILNDASLFVDELNVKLHPLLLKFIINLFYEEDSRAQLIYTTHDTTLMDKRFFRRDQIWFVQKDEYGYSELSALSDFRIRSDASFEKDYLAGVYGGIPLLKEFSLKEGE